MHGTTMPEPLATALTERGLEPQLALDHGMRARIDGGGRAWLAIDAYRDGQVVNTKYRTLVGEKRFYQEDGGTQCLWNEDCLRDETLVGQPLIITEGELDALSVLQSGYSAKVVSMPGGAPKEPQGPRAARYDCLREVRSLLSRERCPEVILAVDGDGPGASLLQDLSVLLGRYRCRYLVYPKDYRDKSKRLKDLNEVLRDYGPSGVTATLERAQFIKVDGVYAMSELPALPPSKIYPVPRAPFGKRYKLRLGDFSVWTGIPSHGKSSMVNDLCCMMAKTYGLKTAFASFEQAPQRDHLRNLRTWYLDKPTNHALDEELLEADEWIDDNFAFLVPTEDDDVTIDWLLDVSEAAVVQKGCQIVVVDPWNEMDHMREPHESLTEYTGRSIKSLRRFARAFQVHMIAVAHPTKQRKDEDGNFHVPTLYDISDSAHWYNKADMGVVVHRFQDHTLVRVAKSRYHEETGEPGDVECNFEFHRRKFMPRGQTTAMDYQEQSDGF